MPMHLLLIPCLLFVAVLSPAQSREPSHRVANIPVPATSGGYGTHAIAAGDHDLDGVADYAVSAPNASDPAGSVGPGVIYVHSGRTSLVLRKFVGDQSGARFGEALAAPGDLNADGVPDLVVGARDHDAAGSNSGRVFAFSGATLLPLWTKDGSAVGMNFGRGLATLADLDSDGALDLAIGEPGYSTGLSGRGRVVFVSGRTGATLGTADGPVAFGSVGAGFTSRSGICYTSDLLGRVYLVGMPVGGLGGLALAYDRPAGADSVASMALLAGPSGLRILIGRSAADSGGYSNNGLVALYEGTTTVWSITGGFTGAGLGLAVAGGVDIDGVAGEDLVYSGGASTLLLPDPIVVGRQDGTVIETVTTPAADAASLAVLGDGNGDGRGEWLQAIFSGFASVAQCHVFSAGLGLPVVTTPAGGFDVAYAADFSSLHATSIYLAAFSTSGSAPGLVPGGAAPLLPLNVDWFTDAALGQVNGLVFPGTLGITTASGTATFGLVLTPSLAAVFTGQSITATALILSPTIWPPAACTNPRLVVVP